MTEAGCIGPMCRFERPDSGAAKGECGITTSYIADAEIYRISDDETAETYYDNSSDTNILMYGSTEWMAFRWQHQTHRLLKGLNVGGTTDWAVDLQSFGWSSRGSNDDVGSMNQSIIYIFPSIWTDGEDPLPVQCPAPCVLVLPDFPLSSTTVISPQPYVTTSDVAWPTTTMVTTSGSTVTTTTVTHILQIRQSMPPQLP
ncbi:hypothetical protein BDV11DRAFT_170643 [Aspergillus similis]